MQSTFCDYAEAKKIFKRKVSRPSGTVIVKRTPKKIVKLPAKRTKIVVNGTVYYHHNGIYYRNTPSGYFMVSGPAGAKIKVLPPKAVKVLIGPVTYHYYYGTYYRYDPDEKVYIVEIPQEEIAGDVVVLNDGEVMKGQFLRGDHETVDFQVGDEIYEIETHYIVSITFAPQEFVNDEG